MEKILTIIKALYVLVASTGWSQVSLSSIKDVINCPHEYGRAFATFLKNGGRDISPEVPDILIINRILPPNPENLEENIIRWTGWVSTIPNDDWDIGEVDTRSTSLTQIDMNKVRLVSMLKLGESVIPDEERVRRIKEAGYIRLDAQIMQTLWKNPERIPKDWLQEVNGHCRCIYFDGTEFLRKEWSEYVSPKPYVFRYFYSHGLKKFFWQCVYAFRISDNSRCGEHNVSAVLIP